MNSKLLEIAARSLLKAHDMYRRGGANYSAYWINDEVEGLRIALLDKPKKKRKGGTGSKEGGR